MTVQVPLVRCLGVSNSAWSTQVSFVLTAARAMARTFAASSALPGGVAPTVVAFVISVISRNRMFCCCRMVAVIEAYRPRNGLTFRFELIRDEHYRPAFEQGIAEQLREIAAITAQDAAPTLENTLLPL